MNWVTLYALLKKKINEAVGLTNKFVDELPEEGESGKLYFVSKDDPQDPDQYFMYVWDPDESEFVLLDPDMDLSIYAKDADLATVAKSGSYDDLTNKPTQTTVTVENKVLSEIKTMIADIKVNGVSNNIFIPSGKESDESVYLTKQTPGGFENLKKITGASVVWNQLVQNGNFADTSNWTVNNGTISASNNKCTLTASAMNASIVTSNHDIVSNHVYLITCDFTASANTITTNVRFLKTGEFDEFLGNIALTANTKYTYRKLYKPNTTVSSLDIYFYANRNKAYDGTMVFENIMFVDLTAYFGNSAIADYVNTLETAQAGSGIAWLQKYGFFTEEYHAYSANTIQSVSVSGHKVVGFNQWDEEWEVGAYSATTGEKTSSSSCIRSKNKISIFPNTVYYGYYGKLNDGIFALFYDKNNTYISLNNQAMNITNTTFTTPNNAHYMTLRTFASGVTTTTYDNNICINISGSRNGEYEPYIEPTTYPLDHTTLRGLFKLDANNNLYADGDIYNADGNGSVKYAEVDMGDLTWEYDSQYHYFRSRLTDGITPISGGSANALCPNYITKFGGNLSTFNDGECWYASTSISTICYIAIKDLDYTDETTFKTAMSGVKLIYELATPTTATLTPFNPLSDIEQGGTEEFVDYGVQQSTRDVAIPVQAAADYYGGNADTEIMKLYVDDQIKKNITDILDASY